MVSSSSLPDKPRRRGGFGPGACMVGWSSVTDTNICLEISKSEDAFRPATGQITDR
jgi:hypothetical protein